MSFGSFPFIRDSRPNAMIGNTSPYPVWLPDDGYIKYAEPQPLQPKFAEWTTPVCRDVVPYVVEGQHQLTRLPQAASETSADVLKWTTLLIVLASMAIVLCAPLGIASLLLVLKSRLAPTENHFLKLQTLSLILSMIALSCGLAIIVFLALFI